MKKITNSAAISAAAGVAMGIIRSITLIILCIGIGCTAFAEPLMPCLTAYGFLSTGEPPYIYRDTEEGLWLYIDDELSISITRCEAQIDQKTTIWYETEIKCRGKAKLTSLLSTGAKTHGHSLRSPVEIVSQYGAVLAFNDDFYTCRWYNKKTQGVVIRNGQIMSDKTFKSDAHAFPPLEVLALFKDGSMKTYKSREHSAAEYLAMGVTDTYAFGPILVHEGLLGERMHDVNYSPYREPRCALGMIAPNHYILLTVEGRSADSRGARLRWLADKMLELGATEALNLDGGNTTYLIFMGDIINLPTDAESERLRRVGSLIGVGVGKNGAVQATE